MPANASRLLLRSLLKCIDFFCELKRVNEMNWPQCTPMHTHAHMPMVYAGFGALMLYGSYFQGVGLIFP